MENTNIRSYGLELGYMGWKYYNNILIKKAMEQKFSWSGLAFSLSIAFFVVIFCAGGLRLTYESLSKADSGELKARIYQLEDKEFRQGGLSGQADKLGSHA